MTATKEMYMREATKERTMKEKEENVEKDTL